MARSFVQPLVGVLLLGAGVAFAWWGFRALALERKHARTEAQTRARAVLDEAATHALAQAENPTSEPLATWWLMSTTPRAGPPLPDGREALIVREAEHLDRVRGESAQAFEMLVRVAENEHAGPWRHMAAWRAAALRLRDGLTSELRPLLEIAARAGNSLEDEVGLRVRTLGLYHLAALGLEEGDHGAVDAFLEAAGRGRWVSPHDRMGCDDLVLALWHRALELDPPSTLLDGTLKWPRLQGAAALALRGHDLFEEYAVVGWYAEADLALRRVSETSLHEHFPSDLVHDFPRVGIASLRVVPSGTESEPSVVATSLPAPLAAFDLHVRPLDPPSGTGAVVGLAAGLLVYFLGCGLALVAIRRSQRVAAMQSDFVAAVSHELKTPIASVRAMAEFLADGSSGHEAKVRDYARRIEGEMGRLGATVRNVLDVARIERQGRLPVLLQPDDPAVVASLTCDAFRPTLEARGFQFDVEVREAPGPVPLDRAALQSVLMNLIDNAAKFSKDVRDVEVEAGPEDGVYRMVVRDRGRGLPSGGGEPLFRRFVRADQVKKDAVPGVGLGLYVVREIVHAHGGTVRAERREGGGSVFTVEIPLAGTKE